MLIKWFLFVVTLALVLISFSKEAFADTPHFCTYEHMSRAIQLNQQRLPLYRDLTDGQSLTVSQELINLEYGLLLTSPAADLTSLPFQIAGIPLLCSEYASMDLVPAFKSFSAEPWPKIENFLVLDIESIKQDLGKAALKKDFTKILKISKQQIARLAKEPQFNCITRHFLESIARAAALAPVHDQAARQKVQISSSGISQQFILSHLLVLNKGQEIDILAAPLQVKGLPILCQDIPPIQVP